MDPLLLTCADPEQKKLLMGKESQLRNDKSQLRDKEKLLLATLTAASAPALDDNASELVRQMEEFAAACRLSLGAEDGKSITLAHYNREPDIIGDVDCIDAYKLPEGLVWPSFVGPKQEDAAGMNLYLHRAGGANRGRVEDTIKRLCERRQVSWVGLPGIGMHACIIVIGIALAHVLV